MNIVFPYLARWRSANRSRYHHLLEGMARRGHRVWVLQPPPLPDAQETNYTEIEAPLPANLTLVDLPIPTPLWRTRFPLNKLVKKGLATLVAHRVIRHLAERCPIDILLLYNIPHVALTRAISAAVVMDVADDLLAMLAHEAGSARRVVLPPARRAFAHLLASAHLVTCSSSVLAERLGNGVRWLTNGADLEAVALADGRAVRSHYPHPIVGYVGAFEYFVDFDLVLDTAARLPHCTFLLVGGGRNWSQVQKEALGRGLANVHLIGPVPYSQALAAVAAMDVALLPLRLGPVADGTCPLKLFEYLALRRPAVSTPTAELCRIAVEWVFFGQTAEEWAAIIRELVTEPSRAAEKVRRGYAAVQSHYCWDRLTEQLEAWMEEAMQRRRAS